ncbi:sulfotransferase [Acetobacter sp. TBRC 12305]|uniref:Sulfotransferase n=1 Tax=Acetobacter garciniae TaxID=2817435 RepID=A0A939KPB5_9PROT|nr:sulfotransferase [Acetobacter garciniae]MBO1326665.1 sulfotransferase [Acetobacter garciniae]MBX0345040.1 sulfotransferase [Acetobacter garciniae]
MDQAATSFPPPPPVPENAEVLNSFGLALLRVGHAGQAVIAFRKALALRPDFRPAHVNLASALEKTGDRAGSLAQFRAILALDRHLEAMTRHSATLERDAGDVEALNALGKALYAIGQREEALARFRAAVATAPDYIPAGLNLGIVLGEMDRVDEAVASFRAVLARDPASHAAHIKIGELLRDQGHYPQALAHLQQARTLRPDDAATHAALARLLRETGEIEAARQAFRRAIALAPDRLDSYAGLIRISRLAADDPALLALRALAEKADSLTEPEQIDLHFALGKALADIGENEEGFRHLLKGNALRRRSIDYDENRMFKTMERVRDLFSAQAIENIARSGHSSECPVFIVGMPRSGSTLVEQILSSHPDVYGAGEIADLSHAFRDGAARFPAWKTLAPLACLSEEERRHVAEDYLQRLNARVIGWQGDNAPSRITNKTLENYFFIGLIHQLWPRARIIHTFRDPVETCLSCFSIPFDDLDFTFDLGELGRRYRHYQKMMAHWRVVLPEGTMLEVRYEDVVEDLEASARRIIAYCGLPWNDACLHFDKSRRPVRTSSLEQVRRPIYRSSIRRWRPDPQTLRPLLDGLGTEAQQD